MQYLPLSSILYTSAQDAPSGESFLLPATILIALRPDILFLLLLLPFLCYITYKDYCVFLSLGRGGTPYNFYGYMRVTALRLVALRDPKAPGLIPANLVGTGYLSAGDLPLRTSPRPNVIGIVPHRQINQRPSKEIFDLLSYRIRNLAKQYPSKLRIAKSCFEKHSPGLFSMTETNKTCSGEVCHAHPSDGSLHLSIHPEDAERVIRAGWGERHPLARGGWCTRFVPQEFLMVYAPRDHSEVDTVIEIVKASIGWVSGSSLPKTVEADLSLHPTSSEEVLSNDVAMAKIEQKAHPQGCENASLVHAIR